jgi:hypothetical protein
MSEVTFCAVCYKRTATCQLIVDFLFEEEHLFSRQLLQETGRSHSPENTIESLVGIGEVLCTTQNTLAEIVDLLVRHPWNIWRPR